MSIADPNKTILTGENPFIRLSLKDGDPNSTDASYWALPPLVPAFRHESPWARRSRAGFARTLADQAAALGNGKVVREKFVY